PAACPVRRPRTRRYDSARALGRQHEHGPFPHRLTATGGYAISENEPDGEQPRPVSSGRRRRPQAEVAGLTGDQQPEHHPAAPPPRALRPVPESPGDPGGTLSAGGTAGGRGGAPGPAPLSRSPGPLGGPRSRSDRVDRGGDRAG